MGRTAKTGRDEAGAAADREARADAAEGAARAKESKAAAKLAKTEAKAAAHESAAAAKSAKKQSKAARKSAKAATKASKAAAAAAEAEAAAKATRPARAITTITDPKTAKRAVTIGKILVPVLAPVLLKAAAGARGFLDTQRAHRLGVPVSEVGVYRGPTGSTRARLDGLAGSVRELGDRAGNDLQTTRFVEVATARIADLTAATEAAASLPGGQRREMLRAIGEELNRIGADLMDRLLPARR